MQEGFMKIRVACLALALALSGPALAAERAPEEITVFAAASLTDVLQEIGAAYTRESGIPIRYSFAASSVLARQIESGAPAHAFLSADLEWMDHLESKALIDRASRRNVAGNALVLIAPAASTIELEIEPNFDIAAALGGGRLAIAEPASVPAGRYARAALAKLGVWNEVESRLAPAENVRAALAYVSRGEAPLGIVYRTDALVDRGVRVVATFPSDTHPPIVYPAAVVAGRTQGAGFVAFLGGDTAKAIFQKHGFVVPGRGFGVLPAHAARTPNPRPGATQGASRCSRSASSRASLLESSPWFSQTKSSRLVSRLSCSWRGTSGSRSCRDRSDERVTLPSPGANISVS
jgi:molybdate transport system substrate-binding protein